MINYPAVVYSKITFNSTLYSIEPNLMHNKITVFFQQIFKSPHNKNESVGNSFPRVAHLNFANYNVVETYANATSFFFLKTSQSLF